MGTNYYVVRTRPTTQSPVHIGKSSAGWFFSFQAQNEKWYDPPIVWNTFNQVKEWLKKYTVDSKEYVIIDEYDEIISLDDFLKMVERKQIVKNTSRRYQSGLKEFPENWKRAVLRKSYGR